MALAVHRSQNLSQEGLKKVQAGARMTFQARGKEATKAPYAERAWHWHPDARAFTVQVLPEWCAEMTLFIEADSAAPAPHQQANLR